MNTFCPCSKCQDKDFLTRYGTPSDPEDLRIAVENDRARRWAVKAFEALLVLSEESEKAMVRPLSNAPCSSSCTVRQWNRLPYGVTSYDLWESGVESPTVKDVPALLFYPGCGCPTESSSWDYCDPRHCFQAARKKLTDQLENFRILVEAGTSFGKALSDVEQTIGPVLDPLKVVTEAYIANGEGTWRAPRRALIRFQQSSQQCRVPSTPFQMFLASPSNSPMQSNREIFR